MTIISHAKDNKGQEEINTVNISLKSIGYSNRRDALKLENLISSTTANQQRALFLIQQINTIINNIETVQNSLMSINRTILKNQGKAIPER